MARNERPPAHWKLERTGDGRYRYVLINANGVELGGTKPYRRKGMAEAAVLPFADKAWLAAFRLK
jgi:hypothetical protein